MILSAVAVQSLALLSVVSKLNQRRCFGTNHYLGTKQFITPVVIRDEVACAIHSNFSRKPVGVFWFQLGDGQSISKLTVSVH